jgi:glucuronosyltransferase
MLSFQNFLKTLLLLTACCLLFIQNVATDKILGVFAFPGQSHSMMLLPIMKELAHRGHEVTVISNYPINERVTNYTEILIEPVFDYWKNGR